MNWSCSLVSRRGPSLARRIAPVGRFASEQELERLAHRQTTEVADGSVALAPCQRMKLLAVRNFRALFGHCSHLG